MPNDKIVVEGKDVQEAIKKACKVLQASQEDLDIEVLTPGSSGIFGLCRKKARLQVARKSASALPAEGPLPAPPTKPRARQTAAEKGPVAPEISAAPARDEAAPDAPKAVEAAGPPLDPAVVEAIKEDIRRLLELMGCPSTVTVSTEQNTVIAGISGPYDNEVVGPEGRTLDSLQYILRKITNKKFSEKILLSLDVGDFRSVRLKELEDLGRKLAIEVKETGKSQTIPALNPSERRIVHMALQDDKNIRSRSVGEGLFKKILIYRPGAKKPSPKKRK